MHPNRRAGRWNLERDGVVQYLSLDAEAPFAEMLRGEDLRTERRAQTFKTTLWELRVDEAMIADYMDFDKADAAGFPAEALVDDDHERCQAEADRLRGMGARGVLAPSAALPGSLSLTLFGPRVQVDWSSTAALASMVAAHRLIEGHPPPGLVARTRFYGVPHGGLVAHRRSRRCDPLGPEA